MTDGPMPAVDLNKLPPPTTTPARPVPKDASRARERAWKHASREWERAWKTHRSRFDDAQRDLRQAEKDYASRVEKARAELRAASTPRALGSVGVIRRVTLTETRIKTPKGEYALTPGVHARAEQHGTKQVVQGWVFKSDNDRREVYLHLEGPDWGVVVPFSIRHSAVTPRDLHDFASKVNVAARNSEGAQASIAERTLVAERRLADVISDRAEVVRMSDALVAAASAANELSAAAQAAENGLEEMDASDRRVRELRATLGEIRARAAEQSAIAAERDEAVREQTEEADRRASRYRASAENPQAPAAAPAASPDAPATAVRDTSLPVEPDVFEQIRKLGELRDAHLITAAEFEAKKSDLLGRL